MSLNFTDDVRATHLLIAMALAIPATMFTLAAVAAIAWRMT